MNPHYRSEIISPLLSTGTSLIQIYLHAQVDSPVFAKVTQSPSHRGLHRSWRSWCCLSACWQLPAVSVSGVSVKGLGHGVSSVVFD
jgi:hypothetical protein